MRVRLRPAHSPSRILELYPAPHNHTRWADHLLRVKVTIEVARFVHPGGIVADLSCGDACIPMAVHAVDHILGDLAPGYRLQGPIEETLDLIPRVGLFVCCETLEHLDDPDSILARIRAKTDALVLSTPDGEQEPSNEEHYWGWDAHEVGCMLGHAGFTPVVQSTLKLPGLAAYQIWGCR